MPKFTSGVLRAPANLRTSLERVAAFWAFVHERHMVWHRRFENGWPSPWTDDPILARYKFCNVYRELDRGTQWWLAAVGRTSASLADKLFKTALYRLSASSMDVWDAMGGLPGPQDDLPAFFDRVREAWYSGAFKWSRAYSLPGHPIDRDVAGRLQYAAEDNVGRATEVAEVALSAGSPEKSCAALRGMRGLGPFLSYQVYLDLVTSGDLPFGYGDWAHIGPGADPVFRWMFYDLWAGSEQDMLRLLERTQESYLSADFPYWLGRRLALPDLEHCLCEWRKYLAVAEGQRGGRALYAGPRSWGEGEMGIITMRGAR